MRSVSPKRFKNNVPHRRKFMISPRRFHLFAKDGKRADLVACALLFGATLLLFWLSPVYQGNDSKYSLLVSESLLRHGTFRLDDYNLPRLAPVRREDYIADGDIYQLEYVGDHVYYFFPPGSSILAVPYVALMNALGISAANTDKTYNDTGEATIEASLAALLMATLAVVFHLTARLMLPRSWSLLVALGGSLGTQIWSTASRGLSFDTWGVLLFGFVLWMLLAEAAGKRKLNPILLATLLAWMYFVRPTNAVHILAITAYMLAFQRRKFIAYAVTGATWLTGFVLYSRHNFAQTLPNYFMTRRLSFDAFWTALAGNLISPSRGLLIYVPVLLFVAYLLVRYRHTIRFARLIVVALAAVVGHLIAVSGFAHWWGGASYGARFMTGLVPWFVLLGILGLDAMRREWRAHEKSGSVAMPRRAFASLAIGGALLIVSVWINGRGAMSQATAKWNVIPTNIDKSPERLWDWSNPQFLAGLLRPPLPHVVPLIEAPVRVDFASREADKFLWYGWSGAETNARWTEAKEAAIVFSLKRTGDVGLRIECAPFLVKDKLAAQRVLIDLNGKRVDEWQLTEAVANIHALTLTKDAVRSTNNVLTFKLPDAAAPKDLSGSTDKRLLGISVHWMEIVPPNER